MTVVTVSDERIVYIHSVSNNIVVDVNINDCGGKKTPYLYIIDTGNGVSTTRKILETGDIEAVRDLVSALNGALHMIEEEFAEKENNKPTPDSHPLVLCKGESTRTKE